MKHILFSALVLLASPVAHAAASGDCMISSGKNLSGQTLSFSHKADPSKVSSTLPFVPQSFYIAKGYALKIFERPYFGGAGLLIGRPTEIYYASVGAERQLQATDGGYFFNADALATADRAATRLVFPVNTASLACVPAGTPYDATHRTRLSDVSYYDQSFFLAANGRADSYDAQLTHKDGQDLLTMHVGIGYVDRRSVTITIDLNSLDIKIDRDGVVDTFASNGDGSKDMRYLGGLSIASRVLGIIINNDRAYRGPGAEKVFAPNLELQPVLEILDDVAKDAL